MCFLLRKKGTFKISGDIIICDHENRRKNDAKGRYRYGSRVDYLVHMGDVRGLGNLRKHFLRLGEADRAG